MPKKSEFREFSIYVDEKGRLGRTVPIDVDSLNRLMDKVKAQIERIKSLVEVGDAMANKLELVSGRTDLTDKWYGIAYFDDDSKASVEDWLKKRLLEVGNDGEKT